MRRRGCRQEQRYVWVGLDWDEGIWLNYQHVFGTPEGAAHVAVRKIRQGHVPAIHIDPGDGVEYRFRPDDGVWADLDLGMARSMLATLLTSQITSRLAAGHPLTLIPETDIDGAWGEVSRYDITREPVR